MFGKRESFQGYIAMFMCFRLPIGNENSKVNNYSKMHSVLSVLSCLLFLASFCSSFKKSGPKKAQNAYLIFCKGKAKENRRRTGGEPEEPEENRRRTGGEPEENRRRTGKTGGKPEENRRRTGGTGGKPEENRRRTGGDPKIPKDKGSL